MTIPNALNATSPIHGNVPQEFVVDQQIRQIQNIQALQPINGPQLVGVDGSKTSPQVVQMVSPMDGELPRPSTIGNDFYRKAREIRRDPTTRLARELSIAPLLMAEWEYEATKDAPEGAKDLVESIMGEMRLSLMRTSLLGQCDFGWQPFEIIAEARDDGTTAPRLKPLLQDITSILVNAADGSFFGLRQTPMIGLRIGWIYLLDQECCVISQDVEGTNWYGEPTLRSVEPIYDETQTILKASRKYDAKIAGTHWVIYYPLGTSNIGGVVMDNGEVAKKLLHQAEAVGGIAVPRSIQQVLDALTAAQADNEATQWKIDLLSDEGKGQTAFMDKLKYLDTLKVRAFGFPERAVLEGQFGTKAEAESHQDIAVSNFEVRHALMTLQFNQKLIDRVILPWNYGPGMAGKVRIKPSPLADKTLDFFQKVYEILVANPQGFLTEISALDLPQLRDRLGLPALEVLPSGGYDPLQAMWHDPLSWPQTDPMGQPQFPPQNQDFTAVPGAQPTTPLPLTYSRESDAVDNAVDRTRQPTKKQAKAGNYRKGKARLHGLTVSIENPKGTRRRPEWPKLSDHYGYINSTTGSDGGAVDAFIGKHPDSEVVFVVDQIDQKTGRFDEHKAMLGYKNKRKAVQAYRANYPASFRVGPVTTMTVGQLRDWLDTGDTTAPLSNQVSA